MRTSTAGAVFGMLTALGMGCVAHGAQVQPASGLDARRDCVAESKLCSRSPRTAKLARRDVMTWRDYYTGVMDEAFRRNSAVIWVNPPTPIGDAAVAQGALPPDIAPTSLGH